MTNTITKTLYIVSTYNDTPFNDEFKTTSYLEADLKVSENIKNKKYGMLIKYTFTENKEFPQLNKTIRETIKEF